MNQAAISEQMSAWLEPAGKRLKRGIDRSAQLRILLLGILNAAGCLVMLLPPVTAIAAGTAALQAYHNVQGPLDWFLVEVLGALALTSSFVSIQLLLARPGAPSGITVKQQEHTAFFAILVRRVRHFKSHSIDAVKLTMAPEIRVCATPKWPVPFLHTHTLCIGAPLMFFLSEHRFRLALAGAVAAAASTRSLSGWLGQASRDWPHIVDALERNPSFASRLLLPAARWLALSTGALNRDFAAQQQRFQSRWIMDQSGEDSVAEYIAAIALCESYLSKQYWPMIFKSAERCAQPVVRPFGNFEILLEKSMTAETAQRWILQSQAGHHGSGRTVRDLLAELNLDQLHWSGMPQQNAFAQIFGDKRLLDELDELWRTRVAPDWERRHSRFQQQRSRFEQLQEKARHQSLRGDSAINYVKLATRFLKTEDSISVYRQVLSENLDSAAVSFVCGQEMLAAGYEEEAIDALQHAAELDSALANRVHAIVSTHRQTAPYRKQSHHSAVRIA